MLTIFTCQTTYEEGVYAGTWYEVKVTGHVNPDLFGLEFLACWEDNDQASRTHRNAAGMHRDYSVGI